MADRATETHRLEPFVPAAVELGDGIELQVCWDADRRELVVLLHGRRAGYLAVLPRAGNSVSIVRLKEKSDP